VSDGLLLITIVAFFLAAVLLVRACGHITAGAADDEVELGEEPPEHEPEPP
jgi:hypothetical protein